MRGVIGGAINRKTTTEATHTKNVTLHHLQTREARGVVCFLIGVRLRAMCYAVAQNGVELVAENPLLVDNDPCLPVSVQFISEGTDTDPQKLSGLGSIVVIRPKGLKD